MDHVIFLPIQPQPTDTTCGPTCLQALYQYYGDPLALEQVIRETGSLEGGGTLGVLLACHALRRGYQARIYTYNMQLFDPSWFSLDRKEIARRLREQARFKEDPRLEISTQGYLEFLELGGEILLQDLDPDLLLRYLKASRPILAGVSATYLYRTPREFGRALEYDDIRGEPVGHFVLLCGYDARQKLVQIADPLVPNPLSPGPYYRLGMDRVICSVLLGVLTYDANLVIIEPAGSEKRA